MTEIILISTVIFLQVALFIFSYGKDDEKTRLRKRIEIKTLRLSDKALDVQLHNTAAFVKSLSKSEEDDEEKTTNPIGFGASKDRD